MPESGCCGGDLFFTPLDSAIFESVNGELRASTSSPGWLKRLEVFHGDPHTITEQMPYLDCFLPEAECFWDQGRDGHLTSDFWTQSDGSGCIHLLAYAFAREGQRFLLIRSVDRLYNERERVQRYTHETLIQLRLAARRQAELGEMATSLKASNTRLNELLSKDALTGIYNRRHFNYIFELELRFANELDAPLSILYLDIDHFKSINDQHGHIAGDAYLSSIGKLLQSVLHLPRDIAARVGGEEFAMILPGTKGCEAIRLAHSLSGMIRELRVPNPISRGLLNATVSIGVFTRPFESQATVAEMLRAADRALYQAKDSGRNCVVDAARLV